MNTTTANLDREIHTSTDEIISAHERQVRPTRPTRPVEVRSWLLGTGLAVLAAAAAVAISMLAG